MMWLVASCVVEVDLGDRATSASDIAGPSTGAPDPASSDEPAASLDSDSSTTPTSSAVTPTPAPSAVPSPTSIPTPTPVPTHLYVDASATATGDGSRGAPFATLTEGLLAVGAGQTLVVTGGEYRERIELGEQLRAGSESTPIVVTAATGERPVVVGRLALNGLRHWTIRGINVTWDDERNDANDHMVVIGGGSDWVFERAELWGARSFAALLINDNPADWAVRHLHVHDTVPANDTNQDHLIYCNCGNGGGVIERNLLVGSPNGRGIKLGTVYDTDAEIANVVVRYNTIVDNGGPSNIQLSYRTSDIVIEHNLLVAPSDGYHNVTAWSLEGDNIVVRSNLGWDSVGVVDDGLTDGGGNVELDPQLDADFAPQAAQAQSFGHLAP